MCISAAIASCFGDDTDGIGPLNPLFYRQNEAVEKDKLISEVWGAFSEVDASTLTVHIRWLREKLEENPSKPEHILTVFKVGYKLV